MASEIVTKIHAASRRVNTDRGDIRVVDLFSGAGGMSWGFKVHRSFDIVGAVDIEVGKPSTGEGVLQCNDTYEANIGIRPVARDLAKSDADEVAEAIGLDEPPAVLLACAPCTGFSRTNAQNHLRDDPRNTLVGRIGHFAKRWRPAVILVENARELLTGRFSGHAAVLFEMLHQLNYRITAGVHLLNRFGVPQARERALVIATAGKLPHRTLDDLWDDLRIDEKATHVRRAIWNLPPLETGETHWEDANHTSTRLEGEALERIRAVPKDGGSWADLLQDQRNHRYLIPSMWRSVQAGRLNHHCDAYGRMAWDRSAPTIKRECAHPGNGRYSHPEQDRLCTVREMAILQGFPRSYQFVSRSRKNAYRSVGDAVPPILSYQLAWLTHWILKNLKPSPDDLLLPDTHLEPGDIMPARQLTL
jgi:DNA (cytosine-5)-methyltransferase 1